jgi:hypothetical protein
LRNGRQKASALERSPIYGEMTEWLEWQDKRRAAGCDLVFHWNGKHIGSHLKGWDRSCTDAGLEDVHSQDLRRSAIRNMERRHLPFGRNVVVLYFLPYGR